MTDKRAADWPRKLNLYLQDADKRYRADGLLWGVFDCAIFAADWVKIATGDDPMADYRGRYDSAESAAAALKSRHGSIVKAMSAIFGAGAHPAMGQRGDIAWRRRENALGILMMRGAHMKAVFLGEDETGAAGSSGEALDWRDIDEIDAVFPVGRAI